VEMILKERVLKLLKGEEVDLLPIFNGNGNIIKPVLVKYGIVIFKGTQGPRI